LWPFGGGSYEIRLAGRLSDWVLAALECEARGSRSARSRRRWCCTARCRTRPRSAACWAVTPVELHEPAAERQERLGHRA
jgi:hypothetical protein